MKKIISLLIICLTFFMQTANAADYSQYPPEVQLAFQRQDELAKKMAGTATKSVGASVEVNATKTVPISVVDKAKNATVATLEATVKSKPLITPTATRIASSIGQGVAAGLIVQGIVYALGKAIDYINDPANSRVILPSTSQYTNPEVTRYLGDYSVVDPSSAQTVTAQFFNKVGINGSIGTCTLSSDSTTLTCPYARPDDDSMWRVVSYSGNGPAAMSYQQLAENDIAAANQGNAEAQAGIQQVVNNMISNNEIGDDVLNQNPYYDNSNDVINNYITNNYPGAYTGVSGSTAVGSPGTSTTTSNTTTKTDNTNNTVTTTTTNTTTNNNNITNVTITNNTTTINNNSTPKTPSDNPASSTSPTSSPAPTSAPSPTKPSDKPTDSSKFELPAFCDWAKPVCDFMDWVKKEPDDKDNELDIPDNKDPDIDTSVNFNGTCPKPYQLDINFFGTSINLKLLDTAMLCDFLATYISPTIKVLSALSVVYIMARDDKEV